MNRFYNLLAVLLTAATPAIALQASIENISRPGDVPVGSLATLRASPTSLTQLPFPSELSNATSRLKTSISASWLTIDGSATTENIATEPFRSNGAGISSFVEDHLTITGQSTSGTLSMRVEFEVSGSFDVRESIFTNDVFESYFDGLANMRLTQVSYYWRDTPIKPGVGQQRHYKVAAAFSSDFTAGQACFQSIPRIW